MSDTMDPDIEYNPTPEQAAAWEESFPRNYKFRVMLPDHKLLRNRITSANDDTRLGKDLDQLPLKFRGAFRPRARFLWLSFAASVLR
ncbi:hypothetical protein GGR56DRAFT_437260 [Xylariaceae sp. FL0804]|nr:hypothetical protein GGR56DRAFT_437260 [Xylariaceae sp. FL0804]